MARSGAPSNRRRNIDHLFHWDRAELIDGTVLTKSVYWDIRMRGVLMLDGSHQFFPAAQVRRCWMVDDEPAADAKVLAVREEVTD